jgi:hypothetical protein
MVFKSSSHPSVARLLGHQASKINSIISEYGTSHNIKIRLRGIGSGFTEGPTGEELPEPLHFVISVAEEGVLNSVTDRVRQLIDTARQDPQGTQGQGIPR